MQLIENFDNFIQSIPLCRLSEEISRQTGKDQELVEEKLNLYINEAQAALHFVAPFLRRDIRILEIGAGICVLSLFLKGAGYKITALEPTLSGFDFFAVFQKVIVENLQEIDLSILRYPAQDLQEKRVGRFDLIFSFNVIEHIPNPCATLTVLLDSLTPSGQMAHSCPNYLIPYEPHFGIPVLSIWPALSRFVFRKKIISNEEMWNSLNFITYLEVKRFARKHGVAVHFAWGLLYDAMMRLESDPIFCERQKNDYIKTVLFLVRSVIGMRRLKKLPPCCATPMNFVISREDGAG